MTATQLTRDELGKQGFGAMRLRESDEPDRSPDAVIGAVLDAGVTMIDTADAYRNEEIVGRAIGHRRAEVLLASKFGLRPDPDSERGFAVRADPAYVREACEASLRRLGVDTIDLYYLHHRSPETPIEDTVTAMAGLVEQGKIRAIGLSNVTADDLRRAHAVHPVSALQEMWSLVDRDVENSLVPTATELGVTVVAHSPTSHGRLHAEAAEALRAVAERHGVTAGQIALAWVHRRSRPTTHVVPLPGTTRVAHALENIAAADIDLSDADLAVLDSL